MALSFVPPHHPILVAKVEQIASEELGSPDIKNIIDSMLEVAYGEQRDAKRPVMVGLAAPQVGIAKRIILVDIAANGRGGVGDLRIYLNPEIIYVSSETNEWYEGCYSTSYVCGIVSRPTTVKVKAYDASGKEIEEEHTGYTSRIFQHEIDHLDGKVFVDHITNPAHLHHVEKDEFTAYRNNEGWRNWPNKVTFEGWKKLKRSA